MLGGTDSYMEIELVPIPQNELKPGALNLMSMDISNHNWQIRGLKVLTSFLLLIKRKNPVKPQL